MDKKMFCYQCEQTVGCTGCTGNAGVCGKKAGTARFLAAVNVSHLAVNQTNMTCSSCGMQMKISAP